MCFELFDQRAAPAPHLCGVTGSADGRGTVMMHTVLACDKEADFRAINLPVIRFAYSLIDDTFFAAWRSRCLTVDGCDQ
ncbi:MAG: hypothetical protein ROZ09_13910 [Thiobacillus sp.]|jgi:hypothetical protein|uniref:hypothetical protein n=1 Tax=Thiobacillus sp. TaxID=924 RepID=UPI0028954FAF|nr:hypothetical protein [Thiobacillus sp.]MDT3707914.1 hypothetical protein [Thiobacillus sp.]